MWISDCRQHFDPSREVADGRSAASRGQNPFSSIERTPARAGFIGEMALDDALAIDSKRIC
jgi:hypothetical protein